MKTDAIFDINQSKKMKHNTVIIKFLIIIESYEIHVEVSDHGSPRSRTNSTKITIRITGNVFLPIFFLSATQADSKTFLNPRHFNFLLIIILIMLTIVLSALLISAIICLRSKNGARNRRKRRHSNSRNESRENVKYLSTQRISTPSASLKSLDRQSVQKFPSARNLHTPVHSMHGVNNIDNCTYRQIRLDTSIFESENLLDARNNRMNGTMPIFGYGVDIQPEMIPLNYLTVNQMIEPSQLNEPDIIVGATVNQSNNLNNETFISYRGPSIDMASISQLDGNGNSQFPPVFHFIFIIL